MLDLILYCACVQAIRYYTYDDPIMHCVSGQRAVLFELITHTWSQIIMMRESQDFEHVIEPQNVSYHIVTPS